MRTSYVPLYAILLAVPLFAGCGTSDQNISDMKSMEDIHAEQGIPVRTETVAATDFAASYSYNAVLSGIKETTTGAMVSDVVTSINYSVGDRVAEDAVVLTFPTDTPTAQYFQAKSAFELAETTLGRFKNLYENGGISLQDYDSAQTQFNVAQANWDAVQQTVTVKAPISGVLTNIAVRLADHVKQGDALFTIARTDSLKVHIWATEHEITDITEGNRATAEWQNTVLEGTIVQVDRSLNEARQAFGVIAEFDNPGSRVLSGVNANVVIYGAKTEGAVITARKNVLHDGDTHYVYIAQNGVARKREVHIGRNIGIDVEVLDGLVPGDTLITEGLSLLEDNADITVVQ